MSTIWIKTLFKSKFDHIDSNFDTNFKLLKYFKDFLNRIFINNIICYYSGLGATNNQFSCNVYTAHFVKTNTSRAQFFSPNFGFISKDL